MRKKRALLLMGAGASLEFGAPSTDNLTKIIERKILANEWMQTCASDSAWLEIKDVLARYYKEGPDQADCEKPVNFEHIYHCAHELIFTFDPTPGAVQEYRPILVPFVTRRTDVTQNALRELLYYMTKFILEEFSAICASPITHLDLLHAFLTKLQKEHITRVYTTNYDDFVFQAKPNFYTGFSSAPCSGKKSFDWRQFWTTLDQNCIFHLHGSVHLSFGLPSTLDADLNALYWYDDRAEALVNSTHTGSDDPTMDGGGTLCTPIITGLDKLSPLQRQPFSHYYASMAHDAMAADVIFVIGCGLGDLHLNTWLGEARRRDPKPPLIFVDRWRDSFPHFTSFDALRKEAAMIHTLRMPFGDHDFSRHGIGWNLDRKSTYAVWDKGFLKFLKRPGELHDILGKLNSGSHNCS